MPIDSEGIAQNTHTSTMPSPNDPLPPPPPRIPLRRQQSCPTTKKEKASFYKINNYCFEGGEEITIYMCERPIGIIAPFGFHMGIKVVRNNDNEQKPKEFTLGFMPAPSVSLVERLSSLLTPVPSAIYIPDPYLEKALQEKTAIKIYTIPKISKNAAAKLNNYTCKGLKEGKCVNRGENSLEFAWTTTFLPKNDLQYKLIFGNERCVNCRGFISAIFEDNPEVIRAINKTRSILFERLTHVGPAAFWTLFAGATLVGGRKKRRKKLSLCKMSKRKKRRKKLSLCKMSKRKKRRRKSQKSRKTRRKRKR